MTVDPSILPGKDAAIFKAVVQCYENKQYKKGLKAAEQLVARNPKHGESMAMKGLFLANLERKPEGYEHVRLALRLNMKSHVCWHVYGLLYRADKNYEEAIKCYRNALRFDPENGQIFRDMAVLQLQTRDYGGLCESRYQLLSMRPMIKHGWISLAIAYHLDGKHGLAVSVIDALLKGFPLVETRSLSANRTMMLEQAEVLFYKAFILEDAANFKAAYEALDRTNFASIPVDALRWFTARARLALKCGRAGEAAALGGILLDSNPDSREALACIISARCATPLQGGTDDRATTIDTLKELISRHPRSLMLKGELIKAAEGEDLMEALKGALLPLILKGVPSAFTLIRKLYRDKRHARVLLDFAQAVQDGDRARERAPRPPCTGEERDRLDGSVSWAQVFLAQHYSAIGEDSEAIRCMERVVAAATAAAQAKGDDGSPSAQSDAPLAWASDAPEVFLIYAKILRRASRAEAAAECINVARLLSPSDRYLNSKTVKYFLRVGRIAEAERLATLFLRKNELGMQSIADLVDMQASWFSIERALAHQGAGRHQEALTIISQTLRHFDDFYDDQFDFHNYILRKMTLSSYIQMMRYEDCLYGHPVYAKCVAIAVDSVTACMREPSLVGEERRPCDGSSDGSALVDALASLSIAPSKEASEGGSGQEGQRSPLHAQQQDLGRCVSLCQKCRPADWQVHLVAFKYHRSVPDGAIRALNCLHSALKFAPEGGPPLLDESFEEVRSSLLAARCSGGMHAEGSAPAAMPLSVVRAIESTLDSLKDRLLPRLASSSPSQRASSPALPRGACSATSPIDEWAPALALAIQALQPAIAPLAEGRATPSSGQSSLSSQVEKDEC